MIDLEIIQIFKWWLIFLILGITFYPITARIFSNFSDKGYIFSKIIGLLAISYVVFSLGSLHILRFSELNILLIWFLLILPQILLIKKEKIFDKKVIKFIIIEEIIFTLSLFLWIYIKGFNPDIHNLEKFMDFGFINSVLRSDYFPTRDIWFTPLSINYYYFGHLFTAVITKLSHIPSYITFNLMLSTIFAFTFTMSFSIGINLIQTIKKYSIKKSLLLGLFFAYIVSFSGNLQTIYAFFTNYTSDLPRPFWELGLAISTFPNSYWYPSATRFIYHTIHEFPLYSFVVADIHGHVLDIPVVLTIIAVLLSLFISKKIKYYLVIFLSFLISIAYMTNAWDALIYLALSIIIFFFISLIYQEKEIKTKIIKSVFKTFIISLLLIIFFFIFTYLFNSNFEPFATGVGINCSPSFLTDIKSIGPLLFENGFCQITPFWQLLILYGFFIFVIIAFLIFLYKKKLLSSDIFVIIISIFSFLLIITPEIIYLKDIYAGHFRANTMFKLSYQAFIMLSISSVYAIIRILVGIKEIKKKSIKTKSFYLVFIFILIPLLLLISIYPYFAIPSGYSDLNNRKNLNGTKYLENLYPQDYKAIRWINENIEGQPVILEAQGDSYTNFARISANTGLPTVLGWTVHEWLWRGSYDTPAERIPDISTLYETKDAIKARQLIEDYNITYIYIGELEKEKYPNIYENKFYDLGEIVFSSNETKIFKIN